VTCSGAYATANDFAAFWCIEFSPDEEPQINRALQMASTPIHAARASNKACDCSLDEWAETYLTQLACILAATTYNCKCSNLALTVEEKRMYMEATTADLALIRTGQTELCAGETGTDFAVVGWAQYSFTERNAAKIIANDLEAGSG